MATITKKELIDRIAEQHQLQRMVVKHIVQSFLDAIIEELSQGNRLEFRDFGVFECRTRAARKAQNPKTLAKVNVPPKRTVKFKVGRVMKTRMRELPPAIDEATGLAVEAAARRRPRAAVRGATR
ncbi:MAG: integration host factor subunit beta [Planctomycetes bacterium]|nr:integration host factor subunit beta [Planctomycetota bacterium]